MFQTARELFQQRMEEEEDEGEEGERGKREWRKPKSRSGQMYHVNANGEFSDSGGEEEEEEVSIAEQIRRKIGLGSKVAVEKGKPGVKGSKMVQSGSKWMQGESKSMQSTQKSMQSTLNFKQHTSKSPSSLPSTSNSTSTSIPSSSLPPSKSQAIPLPTSTSPPHPQSKSQSKPKSKPSPEKKTKPISSSSPDTQNTLSSSSFSSSSHTNSSLIQPPSSSSAPSRKRPSPSTLETSPQSPLDLSKAPDRSMSLPIPHFTHRPKKLLLAISEDVQKLTACLDVSAKQRIKCVEASSRFSSLTPSLQKKYHVALTPYLPSDWVDCIAWQQARLQEHQLIAENRQNERAQADIRSFFGKHGSADQSEKPGKPGKPGKLLSRYKAGYAKIFGEVVQCGKDGRLPPFVPVNAEINAVNTENLMLTTKCRWSLLPFCSPEALTPILKHVVMLIARQTPKDEGKEEFAKRVHSQVDKSIKLKQPFLLKSDSRLCFKHVLYIVE